MLTSPGSIRTYSTAPCTFTDAVPDFPRAVAMITTVPLLTAVTSPVLDTVAAGLLLFDHVTSRPGSGFPAASRAVAVI
jgi:hypothetical protein